MPEENENFGEIRLAIDKDIPDVIKLLTPAMIATFRLDVPEVKLQQLIDCSVLAITHFDKKGQVIGFLALNDFPLTPAVDPGSWEEWVWACYRVPELNAQTNLFVSALIWSAEYGYKFLINFLSSVFIYDAYVENITMFKPPPNDRLTDDSLAEVMFRQVTAVGSGKKDNKVASLFIATRKDVCPRLMIRRAMEADNDDLIAIINSQAQKLENLYGAYYISELVARHPESHRVILVAEYKEVVVGVMFFNDEVNLETLAQNFDLSPFCGLKKVDIIDLPKAKSSNLIEVLASKERKDVSENTSKGSFASRDSKRNVKDVHNIQKHNETFDSDSDQSAINYLELIAIDDDSEYDIINIDSALLRALKPADNFLSHLRVSENQSMVTFEEPNQIKAEYTDIEGYTDSHAPILSYQSVHPYPIIYQGPPNAFVLELFVMDSCVDERRGFDILQYAFQVFPDRDYCILTIPTANRCFPLLRHFTRVSPNPCRQQLVREALYVAHRNSVIGRQSVRHVEIDDLPMLKSLADKLPESAYTNLMDEINNDMINGIKKTETLLFLTENQPVGFVNLCKYQEEIYIRGVHNLDRSSKCLEADGSILALVLALALEPHSRWYLREALRKSGFKTLTWKSQIVDQGLQASDHSLISLIDSLAPAMIRCPPTIDVENSRPIVWESNTAFWYIDRPMTSLQKLDVNVGIVVIGASRTNMAFIETLLFGPSSSYLTFTNITLVSHQGVTIAAKFPKAVQTCMVANDHINRNVDQYPIFFYVDVVAAKMVQIDRKEKCITLSNGSVKYYDYLVLGCGAQFQQPYHIGSEGTGGPCHPCVHRPHDDPKYRPDFLNPPHELPENLMLINTIQDANECLKRLTSLINSTKDFIQNERKIIVYGNKLRAYSCMAGILETDEVSPNRIVFVDPTLFIPNDDLNVLSTCFNDEEVDKRVHKTMTDMGITIYTRYGFFNYDVNGSRITTVRFITDFQMITIPCLAFFYFGNRSIDFYMFNAVNECGLVWDGGVVIDSNFCTNDPSIYAVGGMTKYSRALHSDRYIHRYYNSNDVGSYLGERFLEILDPYKVPSKTDMRTKLVPRFKSPVTSYAALPGHLYFIRMEPPGPCTPMLIRRTIGTGHVYDTENNGNIFLLHLNNSHRVERISCLTAHKYSPLTLFETYGKHEKYLGSLMQRYESGLIDDFFAYFAEPWLSALSHGAFEDYPERNKVSALSEDTLLVQDVKKYAEEAANVNIYKAIALYVREFSPIVPQYAVAMHPDYYKEQLPTLTNLASGDHQQTVRAHNRRANETSSMMTFLRGSFDMEINSEVV